MSKTKTKNNQAFYRRPIFWVVAIILILIAVAIVMIVTAKRPTEVAPSNESKNPHTVISSDDNSSSDTQPDKEPDDKVTQYEGENPNSLPELTGSITYKGIDNGVLTVAVTIDQFLADGGTCTLTLTGKNSGGNYTTTTSAFADISTSACQTFEVPTTGLPSDNYDLKIQFSGDNKNGIIEEEVSL